ncbi:MAG: protein-L-isoaspartate(D-aspartate) O-methyltransferase [Chitinivibrionales bacterium]|nr:protein-L-isoaspartate(D-aspartate) O-methyltransferase [Chitinivibrionales bacterium]MBD3394805.1 protein-L-isoaspartate(D-aspartate) O-methyltransferase [Chitinivibrionales bacterium]
MKSHTGMLALVVVLPAMVHMNCSAGEADEAQYAKERERMVQTQIERRGVSDPEVLEAMRAVERHLFVPKAHRRSAYEDRPLPIGEGQTISQPYIVALMTEQLDLDSTMRVLEVGTGSGYQAAVLAEIVDSVYTIEIVPLLGKRAKKLLDELGFDNIAVRIGDGYRGWEEAAPFDAIIVTAAPSHVPEPLKEQLAEGGRMIIPVGKGTWEQELVLLTKTGGKLVEESVTPVRFVPLIREDGGKY